ITGAAFPRAPLRFHARVDIAAAANRQYRTVTDAKAESSPDAVAFEIGFAAGVKILRGFDMPIEERRLKLAFGGVGRGHTWIQRPGCDRKPQQKTDTVSNF